VPYPPPRRFDGQYSVADSSQTLARLPAPTQVGELDSADTYPNTAGTYPNLAERIVRFIRDALAAIVLAMVIVMLVLSARFVVSMGAAIDQWRSTSAVTGCPAGDGQCGG
jgi:hypothetical protein